LAASPPPSHSPGHQVSRRLRGCIGCSSAAVPAPCRRDPSHSWPSACTSNCQKVGPPCIAACAWWSTTCRFSKAAACIERRLQMSARGDVQLDVAPNNQAACAILARWQPHYAAVRRICWASHNRIVDHNRYLSGCRLQTDALDAAVNSVVCTCAHQQQQSVYRNACCAEHGADQAVWAVPGMYKLY
jgi:hypothetical protein